jgi:hypothetical protein
MRLYWIARKFKYLIITKESVIEHGRASIGHIVWVIQGLQEFSKLFVRPQEDEDEQG